MKIITKENNEIETAHTNTLSDGSKTQRRDREIFFRIELGIVQRATVCNTFLFRISASKYLFLFCDKQFFFACKTNNIPAENYESICERDLISICIVNFFVFWSHFFVYLRLEGVLCIEGKKSSIITFILMSSVLSTEC